MLCVYEHMIAHVQGQVHHLGDRPEWRATLPWARLFVCLLVCLLACLLVCLFVCLFGCLFVSLAGCVVLHKSG